MRRLFWALLGIGVGVTVGIAVVRWVRRTKERYSPPNLARQAGARAEDAAEKMRGFVEEVRIGMEEREAELRARLGLD